MRKNKLLIFTLFFAFLGLLFCGLKVSATVTTSPYIGVQGAQIRTMGSAGIRFVGKVEDSYVKTNVTAYGIALAFGEVNVEDIIIGEQVNGKNVINAQVSELNGSNFYINLTDIPENMYGQKVTARSYVVDNGETIYAANGEVRSLGQVALAVKNAGQSTELLESIVTTLNASYKSVFTDAYGNVYVENSVFETNPLKMESVFVEDWNAFFGTEWTEVTLENIAASAANGFSANTDADPSLGDLFKFFRSTEYQDKWLWLLEFISYADSGSYTHPKRQADAIINYDLATSTTSNTLELWKNIHLATSIYNFFKETNEDLGYYGIDFSNVARYNKLEDYNNKIYSIDATLVLVGESFELPYANERDGYDFVGYEGNAVYTDSYTVSNTSETLKPKYTATQYTVKFYDGANELTDLATTYSIESGDIHLQDYYKDGYVFKGWYTTSSFDEGTKVEYIYSTDLRNVELFAKMEETTNVAVNATFDLNGGQWSTDYLLENAEILQEATMTYYNKYQGNGTNATLSTSADKEWWYYITLIATDNPDVFEIGAVISKWDSIKDNPDSYDYVISWHSALTDTTSLAAFNSMYNNASTYAGKYVILQNIPEEETSISASITMKVIDSSELTKELTKTYVDEETLPTPYKANDPFLGWESSVDKSVVTKYPAYTTSPSAEGITYKAIYQSTPVNSEYASVNVTFDAQGGSMKLPNSTFTVNSYSNNGGTANTYMCDTGMGYSLQYQYKIALNYDSSVDAYQVVATDAGKTAKNNLGVTWTHIISNASTDISGYATVGQYIVIDKTSLSAGTAQTAYVYNNKSAVSGAGSSRTYTEPETLPTPSKTGFKFLGWRCSLDNSLYFSYPGYKVSVGSLTYTAAWEALEGDYSGLMIGSFDSQSYVAAGNKIQLNVTYTNTNVSNLKWKSETPNIATVSSTGTVTGVSEGLALIVVSDPNNSAINFSFYVTVFNSTPTGLLGLIAESNNSSIYHIDNLVIGSASDAASGGQWGYYSDMILQSVSNLFFGEKFSIKSTYCYNDGDTYGTFSALGTSVEFITFHYAADTPYATNAAANAGKNLASYSGSASNLSYHFGVGNDGAWSAMPEAYTAWHAGSGSSRTYWQDSGVTVLASDPEIAETTLGSNGYFYINGRKTNVYSPYGTTYKLTEMGFAYKIVGNKYYMPTQGSFRYDSTYNRLCTAGGGVNSIGIESSVRKGSDLWLTWHYSAQLCAYLLNKYNLPLYKLVGHNFWSGKWCPQPMLENDLEIWDIFVQMVKREMTRLGTYGSASLSLSSSSSYIDSNGRLNSQPKYTQCVTYDVTYTYNGETKTVTLSTILPGSVK